MDVIIEHTYHPTFLSVINKIFWKSFLNNDLVENGNVFSLIIPRFSLIDHIKTQGNARKER